jgi:DNA-directed RNA polymerase specialized sigma subunit
MKESKRNQKYEKILKGIAMGTALSDIAIGLNISISRAFQLKREAIKRLRKGESIGGYTHHDFPGIG